MFGDKRAVAQLIGCCQRSVDNLMKRGCPYYKLGHRQVRFDLGEVRDWVKREYGCRRIGREASNAAPLKTPNKQSNS
jgi:predicted DNA-binding transcriptional regulator AlpA